MFLSISSRTHFWWNPFSKTPSLCIKMASSSKRSSFLTSHGKKYDPTFEWHDNDGLLQEPRTHAPYCHVDTKVSLVSLLGKMLLHVLLKVSWWDIITFEISGALCDWSCLECWLWSILEVCFFFLLSWCMLGNIDLSW